MYTLRSNSRKITIVIQGILVFLAVYTAGYITSKVERPNLQVTKQESALNFNSRFLKVASLGNRRFLADLLWVQTLIESDIEHYKQRNLNSWIYLRLKTITELDHLFKEAYYFGGQYLSVIKDDIVGASTIYLKGLKYYPDDYRLNYAAGLHFYLEVGDYQRAIMYLDRIKSNPRAPAILTSILARLNMNQNRLETAFILLTNQLKEFKEGSRLYRKTIKNLYSIRAQIDLDCLNKNKGNCRTFDIYKNPYIKKHGEWIAPRKWERFKLKIMAKKEGK